MLLFRPFGSRGSGAKLCSLLPSDDILVHGEITHWKYHEGRIRELAMEVRVSVLLRELLGVLEVSQKHYANGTASQVKFRVLPFRVKI
jgi:hypothetical protein